MRAVKQKLSKLHAKLYGFTLAKRQVLRRRTFFLQCANLDVASRTLHSVDTLFIWTRLFRNPDFVHPRSIAAAWMVHRPISNKPDYSGKYFHGPRGKVFCLERAMLLVTGSSIAPRTVFAYRPVTPALFNTVLLLKVNESSFFLPPQVLLPIQLLMSRHCISRI